MKRSTLRILYLRTQFNFNVKAGGSVGHTAGVINAFRKKHQVEVISNDKLVGVKGGITLIKPFKINKGLIKDILELIYNVKLLYKLKNISQYDFIYHRYTGSSFIAARLAKKYNKPLILEFNSSALWTIKNWEVQQGYFKNRIRKIFKYLYKLPVTKIIEKYNLGTAKIIIVVSDVLKDNLIKIGIPSKKILVNYNGVDLQKFQPDLHHPSIRKKYSLNNRYVFGFIGTFGYWHGVKELALAIVEFYSRYPECISNTCFLLIGNGILMNEVQQILSKSGVKNNVVLTGTIPQEEAPKYLAACNAFLSPHIPNEDGTRFFGSPTKLFEYMAMGKPIIASKLEQLGSILTHGKNAYLVEPKNINQLSDAMYYTYKNQEFAKRIGENARKDVVRKYTWDNNIENLFSHILKNNLF